MNDQKEDEKLLENENQEFLRPLNSGGGKRPNTSDEAKGFTQDRLMKNQSELEYSIDSSFRPVSSQTNLRGIKVVGDAKVVNVRASHNSLPSANLNNMPLIKAKRDAYTADLTRIKPKSIIQDKERLYEETLQLKSILNMMKQENKELRTKITNMEREAKTYEKIIEDNERGKFKEKQAGSSSSLGSSESYIVVNLKRQLKEMKKTMLKKDEELISLKRNLKVTRLQESEAELEEFKTESFRLKNMLNQMAILYQNSIQRQGNQSSIQLQDERTIALNNTIMTLKSDNLEMAVVIKEYKDKNEKLQQKLQDMDRRLQHEGKEKNMLKQSLAREKEARLRASEQTDQENYTATRSPARSSIFQKQMQTELELKQELDKKSQENSNLAKTISAKDKRIQELEKRCKDQAAEFQEKINQDFKEKQMMVLKWDKERRELQEQVERHQSPRGHRRPNQGESSPSHEFESPGARSNNEIKINKYPAYQEKRKLPKVKHHEVENIGIELKYNMKLKQIAYEDMEKNLFNERIKKDGKVSINEMKEILKSEPFLIADEEALLLVSRYLIENNDADHIILDLELTNEVNVVLTIFKKLVGNYTLMDSQKELKLYSEISQKILKYKNSLKDTLKMFTGKHKDSKIGYVDKLDLENAFKYIEANFSPAQSEYLYMHLFKISRDIENFKSDSIFEIFDGVHFPGIKANNIPEGNHEEENDGDYELDPQNENTYQSDEDNKRK